MIEAGIHVVDLANVFIQMFLDGFKLVAVCAHKANFADLAASSQVKHG